MKKYITEETIGLASGRIGLTDAQAKPRAAKLKNVKKGVYEILEPIEFKAGETILLEAPDKFLISRLIDVEAKENAAVARQKEKAAAQAAKKAAQEEKAKAEAEAKAKAEAEAKAGTGGSGQ